MRAAVGKNLVSLAIALTALSCGGGGSISFGGGIGGTGIVVGVISDFGSVVVEGIEFDTRAATITVDGEPAVESDLAAGMVVTVHGDVDAAGTTGVADSVTFESLLGGPIEDPDAATGTARILGTTVVADADTVFEGVALDDSARGVPVVVSGFVDANGEVRATRIARRVGDAPYSLSGIVHDLDAAAETLRIRRVTVDFGNATVVGAPNGSLADGLFARVRFSALPAGGVVQADEVIARDVDIDQIEDVRVLVRGIVTAERDASSFVLNDTVLVEITRRTLFVGGTTDDVVEDAMVGVLGRVARPRRIVAERIGFRATDGGPP